VVTAHGDDPAVAPGSADAGLEYATVELDLGGMHCSACASRIQRSLNKLPAVASASVNLATHRAFVSYDPSLAGDDDLCAAVTTVGYAAVPLVEDAPRAPCRTRTTGCSVW